MYIVHGTMYTVHGYMKSSHNTPILNKYNLIKYI